MNLKNKIKHPFRPVLKVILATIITLLSSLYGWSQEGSSPSGNSVFEWIELNGLINDIAPDEYVVLFREANSTVVTDSVSIEIKLIEQPVAPVASNQSFCGSAQVSDLVATVSNGNTVEWYTSSTGGTALDASETLANGYYYAEAVSSETSCSSSSRTEIYVSIHSELPVSLDILVSPSNSICDGEPVTFTAVPVNGGDSPEFQWLLNGAVLDGETSVEFTTSNLQQGDEVSCRLTSNETCVQNETAVSNAINMEVYPKSEASITIFASPSEISYQGDAVTFTANAVNQGTEPQYQWKINGTNVDGETGLQFTSTTLKNGDLVTCQLHSNATCLLEESVLSNSISMEIIPLLEATVTIEASPSATICEGEQVTLIASPVNGGTLPQYRWLLNDEVILDETSSTYSSSDLKSGDVLICELTSNETDVAQATVLSNDITIQTNPVPVLAVDQPATVCFGATTDITTALNVGNSTLYDAAITYTNNDELKSALENPTAVSVGSYLVVASTAHNCVASAEITVEQYNELVVNSSEPQNATYLGAADGSITISAITGGVAGDKTINLNDDPANQYVYSGEPVNISGLNAGNYFVLASDANACSSDTLWFTITQPNTFSFTAHIAQNETAANAADGIVVIDTIYASKALNVEVSLDKGTTWSPIVQGDSLKGLPADSIYIQLKAGEIRSEIQGFFILQGCEIPVFTVTNLTVCGDPTGTITVAGLDPAKEYEYVLIPKNIDGKPTITLLGENPVRIVVGSTYTDAGATAYDAVFGDLSARVVVENTVNTAAAGTYTVTYNVSNPIGIAADELVRTVLVEDEVSSIFPVDITFYTHDYTGLSDQNIACGFDFNSPSTIYTINAVQETPESVPEVFITSEGSLVDISGRYTMVAFGIYPNGEMLIIDINNGVLDFNTQTYFNNISCPPISAHNLTVTNGSGSGSYLPGNSIEIVANTPQEGSEFAAWTGDVQYLDDPSNSTAHVTMPNSDVSIEATYQEINVGVPVITLLGDNPLTWILGESFVDPGAIAYDGKDGDITNSIVVAGNVDINTEGTYTITYNVIDSDGHPAEEKTRTVNVEQTSNMIIWHTKQTGFSLQIYCSSYNNVTIKWGDGTSTVVNNSAAKTHTYASAGEWKVMIIGKLDRITRLICQNQSVTAISFDPTLYNLEYLYFDRNTSLIGDIILPSTYNRLKYIQFYSTGISSFTLGLYTTSCQNIYIYSCPLMHTVDLSNLSYCINLFIYSCNSLTSISANHLSTGANFDVHSCNSLTSLTFSAFRECNYFYAYSCSLLTSINLSAFAYCNKFDVHSCNSLTSINLNNLPTSSAILNNTNSSAINSFLGSIIRLVSLDISSCGLLESEVDNYLSTFLSYPYPATLNIGGTNADPSTPYGLSLVTSLRAAGWNVTY